VEGSLEIGYKEWMMEMISIDWIEIKIKSDTVLDDDINI
jgi:hypothetical protein